MDSSIIVVSNTDERKFKMVMRGELAAVSIAKIKRYLQHATGTAPSLQVLTFNNRVVPDDATADQVGLCDGAVMFLDIAQLRDAAETTSGLIETLADKDDEARHLRQQLDQARQRERATEGTNSRLERLIQDQQQQIDDLRRSLQSTKRDQLPLQQESTETKLRRTLIHFAAELGLQDVPTLDSNHTCVVPARVNGEEVSLLLTLDPNSDKLYLYSTLLAELPSDSGRRLRLYETLLEGALLGREMAGGGVGVSVKNELVLLSVSMDLRRCDERFLSSLCAGFMQAHLTWSTVCREFVR
jgi:hypothetical protein